MFYLKCIRAEDFLKYFSYVLKKHLYYLLYPLMRYKELNLMLMI